MPLSRQTPPLCRPPNCSMPDPSTIKSAPPRKWTRGRFQQAQCSGHRWTRENGDHMLTLTGRPGGHLGGTSGIGHPVDPEPMHPEKFREVWIGLYVVEITSCLRGHVDHSLHAGQGIPRPLRIDSAAESVVVPAWRQMGCSGGEDGFVMTIRPSMIRPRAEPSIVRKGESIRDFMNRLVRVLDGDSYARPGDQLDVVQPIPDGRHMRRVHAAILAVL